VKKMWNRFRPMTQEKVSGGALILICVVLSTLLGMTRQAMATQVASASPSDGAVNVSVNLTSVSITFSEVMGLSSSYTTDVDFWGPLGPTSWSGDRKTLTISRIGQEPIPVGVTLKFSLFNMLDATSKPLSHPGQEPGQYSFSFMVGTSIDAIPGVTATIPANGAAGINRNLSQITITFSEPMDKCCISIGSNFPAYTSTWSTDHRQLTLTRKDTSTKLSPGLTYYFTLNGVGYENFRDTQGNFLPETRFTFTVTEEYDYQTLKVPENPAKGFNWPYYLCVPRALGKRTTLLVEPNNTGTWSDDPAVHDLSALNLLKWRSDFALKLDVPLLVPTFPRPINPPAPEPGGIYTHALDRYSLLTTALVAGQSIERIDLQLIAMIRDAQARLTAMGFTLDRKIFMMGFSASGAFTSRFTLLHPDVVRAVAPGSPGGWPLAPVSSWKGVALRYPVGIADLEALTGVPPDLDAFRNVPQYIYVGDLDRNDALDTRGLPEAEVSAVCALLDCRPEPYISDRWPIAEEIYKSVDSLGQFVVYSDAAHTISEEMFADLLVFFQGHKPNRKPANTSSLIPLLLLDCAEP
jgi:pimeloyl-ACP methyl ester carboxylesterase